VVFGQNLVICIISKSQDSKLVNSGKKGWKAREGIKESICIVEHMCDTITVLLFYNI
jgi:hypothetical protein